MAGDRGRSGPLRILAAVEGPSDARRLAVLVRAAALRAARERDLYWVSADTLDEVVVLTGVESQAQRFDLHQVAKFEEQVVGKRLPYIGKVGGGEANQLVRFVRTLRRWLRRSGAAIDGVVWLRDTDGDSNLPFTLASALAAEQERGELPNLPPVAIGCPHQASEAWVVCGYVPRDAAERDRLAALTVELSFDPTEEPQRLLHQGGSTRSGKAVFRRLGLDDFAREEEALVGAATSVGAAASGLTAFAVALDDLILRPILG